MSYPDNWSVSFSQIYYHISALATLGHSGLRYQCIIPGQLSKLIIKTQLAPLPIAEEYSEILNDQQRKLCADCSDEQREMGCWSKDSCNPRRILQGVNTTKITAGIENKKILESFIAAGHVAWFIVWADSLHYGPQEITWTLGSDRSGWSSLTNQATFSYAAVEKIW